MKVNTEYAENEEEKQEKRVGAIPLGRTNELTPH